MHTLAVFVCTRVRLRLCDVTPGALCAERTFLFCRSWRSESWIWVPHDCCLVCIFRGFCVAEQGNWNLCFQVLPGHMPTRHSTIRLFENLKRAQNIFRNQKDDVRNFHLRILLRAHLWCWGQGLEFKLRANLYLIWETSFQEMVRHAREVQIN